MRHTKPKFVPGGGTEIPEVPKGKQKTCLIAELSDNTGYRYAHDMDSDFHKGFTVGNGKKLYWEIIYTTGGHARVFRASDGMVGRWVHGSSKITIHFK